MGRGSHERRQAIEMGTAIEYWYGNHIAYEKAKEGSEMHGYTRYHQIRVRDNVKLAERVQEHMMNTYIKYI
eukprot:14246238-Heterocapsa_arctica.AAC.1